MNTIKEFAISVIIPTYKSQNYIRDCFQSINNQCFDKKKFEVLIILNGEREPYYSLIENYLLQCNFIYRLFYTDIAGVSNARNIGIEESKGRYIAFIDDDDIISENYLQGLYDIAKNGAVPLSYAKSFTNDTSNANNYYITDTYERMINREITILNIRSYFSSACYKLVSSEMIGKQRFNQGFQNGEDALFMFSISEKRMRIQFTDRTAIYYRRKRDDSLTTRKRSVRNKAKNSLKIIFVISKIYFKTPKKYSFLFFISRISAYLKGIFL